MDQVFVDSDIIIDLLGRRVPFHTSADELFTIADEEKVRLKTSSLVFSNVHYMLSKQIGKASARKILIKFKVLLEVLSVNDKITRIKGIHYMRILLMLGARLIAPLSNLAIKQCNKTPYP